MIEMPIQRKKNDILIRTLKTGKYYLTSHPHILRIKSGDIYDDIINYIDKSLNIQLDLSEIFYRIFDRYLYYLMFKSFNEIYSQLLLIFDDIDDSDDKAMLNLKSNHREKLIEKVRFLYFPKDFIDHLEKGYLNFKISSKDLLIKNLINEYGTIKNSKLYTKEQLTNFHNAMNVIIYQLYSKPILTDLTEMTKHDIRIFEETVLKERDDAIRKNYF
jgi:hypothetical protein